LFASLLNPLRCEGVLVGGVFVKHYLWEFAYKHHVFVFIVAWVKIYSVVYSFELKITKIVEILHGLGIRGKGIIKNDREAYIEPVYNYIICNIRYHIIIWGLVYNIMDYSKHFNFNIRQAII
jgi:hypothetical protein